LKYAEEFGEYLKGRNSDKEFGRQSFGKKLKIVPGRMRMNWKNVSEETELERICESELGFRELLYSQGWNQSLVLTRLAGARLAAQL
jgi:hypothetical protein